MRYRIDRDLFEDSQPSIEFLDELYGPVHKGKPKTWNQRKKTNTEIFIEGAYIDKLFPDTKFLLETVYEDFDNFLKLHECQNGDFCFEILQTNELYEEAYRITVNDNRCTVEALDTEGIRRALYFIEDEMMRREGCFLPKGSLTRIPHVKTRISRGFLCTHYTPVTNCEGELEDDTEFYPDNYLNRLAHDGINAIWVQERFRTILPSEIIPEYGQHGAERIKRLNQLIKRCKRYGIKVYLEGIEPASTFQNPGLKNHPELWGQPFGNEHAFCSSTEKGRTYISESTGKLFKLVPDLAGIVNISVGEAVSCCAAVEEPLECPHCKKLGLSKAQVLADCERSMLEGMRAVKPNAELISWAYAFRAWDIKDVEEYLEIRCPEVISMINFEDLGEAIQLGKSRTALDYWLSYTGPGTLFEKATILSKEKNTPLFAKLQVCSSHEVSSVPYVPVPGILYDKYKYMYENHVTGAMYCWYFGNYPSLMSKAAGELSFVPFFEKKEDFLVYLARLYWGKDAEKAAEAYELFGQAYANFPVNMSFEWHGPMTDGPVWPLHLEPVDLPVSRTYKTHNMVGSDRLGEAVLMGHSYEEAHELCATMSSIWKRGFEILQTIGDSSNHIKMEQLNVVEALGILFQSGTNILHFYALREKLGFLYGDANVLLEQMREIVFEEMELSRKLKKLCMKDKRLGYHGEAMGFKFFPNKIDWRVDELKKILVTEFPRVEERIKKGLIPLPFYFGKEDGAHRYVTKATNIDDGEWEYFMFMDGDSDSSARIRLAETEDNLYVQLEAPLGCDMELKAEFRMFTPYVPILLSSGKIARFCSPNSYGLFGERITEELDKWNIDENVKEDKVVWTIRWRKEELLHFHDRPFRLAVTKKGGNESFWEKGDRFYDRLIFGRYSPDSYVFIIPKNVEKL